MKPNPLWSTAVAIATLMAVGTGFAHAQPRELTAVVRSVLGYARCDVGGQSDLPLEPGMRLPIGTVLHTGPGGMVDLFLGRGGGVLRLREGTTVVLETLNVSEAGEGWVFETGISLRMGEILGAVNRLGPASRYEIRTPEGLIGIRGGRFRIQVPGPIQVLDGSLVFVRDGKATLVRGPGELDLSLPVPIRPLTRREIPPLARMFEGMDRAPADPRGPRPPAPQEMPLSPVTGG